MRRFLLLVAALAAFIAVTEQASTVHAVSYSCTRWQTGSGVSGPGHEACTPVGGSGHIQSFQIAAQCYNQATGAITLHYGPRRYVSNQDSAYTCAGGQYLWNFWAEVYL